MNHAAACSLTTRSYNRSMAYALDARGSLCVPSAMREIVPCGTPVASLMAVCVHPKAISAAIFSDVFISHTIRDHINSVNTYSHEFMENNGGMEFKEWLRAAMEARQITPSDLARTSKVPQPTIFRILSGETKDPRTGTVKRLERALGSISPPLADEVREVVNDFAVVYAQSNEMWRTFLKTSIQAARGGMKEAEASSVVRKIYK